MSKSYTPGLKVLKSAKIVKDRILPLKGKVCVSANQKVESDTIVASTELPGNVHMLNIANELNLDPEQISDCMIVDLQSSVKKGQIVAKSKGIFGMFKSEVKTPVNGKIESISSITGQVVISEEPITIKVDAYVPGNVEKIYEKEGVCINSVGTFIQGIIGIGGEKQGKLKVLESNKKDILNNEMKDKIIVCNSYVDYDFYSTAKAIGVKGIICGGFDYNNISKILGYKLGVAITGTEETTTLIVTEGFGEISMSKRTFDLLKDNDNNYASISGATQIRAGVMRPEIFVSNNENIVEKAAMDDERLIISINSTVRVIREPFFGKIGKVISLPSSLTIMKSETKVRVAEIEFSDTSKEIIPRANLEVIFSD